MPTGIFGSIRLYLPLSRYLGKMINNHHVRQYICHQFIIFVIHFRGNNNCCSAVVGNMAFYTDSGTRSRITDKTHRKADCNDYRPDRCPVTPVTESASAIITPPWSTSLWFVCFLGSVSKLTVTFPQRISSISI